MEPSIQSFYERCDQLFRAGDKQAYEAYLEACVADTEGFETSSDAQKTSFRIAVLNEAANWYRGASNYKRAEELFVSALDVIRSCGLGQSEHYARVLQNLAGLYRYTGELDKAEDLFKQTLTVLEGIKNSDTLAVASTMNNLALVYAEQGCKDEALALARKTYAYVTENERANDHLRATELLNISTLLLDCGSMDEAESAVRLAIDIFEGMPKENVHLAAAYNAYATVFVKRGAYKDAYELYLKALDSVERFFGKNIEYAICQENLAQCAFACGMPAAQQHAEEALRVLKTMRPDDDPMVRTYRDVLERVKG